MSKFRTHTENTGATPVDAPNRKCAYFVIPCAISPPKIVKKGVSRGGAPEAFFEYFLLKIELKQIVTL